MTAETRTAGADAPDDAGYRVGMRRPMLLRSLALGGIVVVALTAAGCTADEPDDVAPTVAGSTEDAAALPSASPPPLDELDLDAWGARALPKHTDAVRSTGHVIPSQQTPPVEVTQADGTWTLEVACIAAEGVGVTVTLTTDGAEDAQQLPCASDVRTDPKIATLRYDGGAKTTLSVTGDSEAAFVVQSSKG